MPLYPLYSQVSELEYFIDDDPGVGKAIKVKSNDTNNISFDINKTDYQEGFHLLGVRIKNSLNNWSASTYYNVFIQHNTISYSEIITSVQDTSIIINNLSNNNLPTDTTIAILIPKRLLIPDFNIINISLSNSSLAKQSYDLTYYNQDDKRTNLKEIFLSYSLLQDSMKPKAFSTYKLLKANSFNDNEYSFEINNPQTNEPNYLFNYLLVDSGRTLSHYSSDTFLLNKYINRSNYIGENYLIIKANKIKINSDDKIDFSIIDIVSIRGETMLKHCFVYKDHIDTSALPKGLYLLVIKKNDCVYSRRFIK